MLGSADEVSWTFGTGSGHAKLYAGSKVSKLSIGIGAGIGTGIHESSVLVPCWIQLGMWEKSGDMPACFHLPMASTISGTELIVVRIELYSRIGMRTQSQMEAPLSALPKLGARSSI
jgi:hypothetical protein